MLAHVYDIDGTLTKSGHDLWFLVMREVCEPKSFSYIVEKLEGSDSSYVESYKLLKDTLKLLIYIKNPAKQIREIAKQLTFGLIDADLVSAGAVESLKQSIANCDLVTLNTANYVEAAQGFSKALYLKGLLTKDEYNKLLIIGTTINWESHTIESFNMGRVKIRSYYRYLKSKNLPISAPDKVFIDDPLSDDCALAAEGLEVIVVHNQKSKGYFRGANFKRVYW